MALGAKIVHSMEGRARIRLHGRAIRPEQLDRIAEGLRRSSSVVAVSVNPDSKGILIHHRGPLEQLLSFAKRADLFEIVSPETNGHSPLATVYERFAAADRALKAERGEGRGLATYTFYGLLGASLYQLVRGHFLPAGGALAFQAMSILMQVRNGAQRGSNGSGGIT